MCYYSSISIGFKIIETRFGAAFVQSLKKASILNVVLLLLGMVKQITKKQDFFTGKGRKSMVNTQWTADMENNLPQAIAGLDVNKAYSWGKGPMDMIDDKHRIDVKGISNSGGRNVYIEAENRPTCVRNVLKVWMPIDKGDLKKPILFVHVFSPDVSIRGKEEAKFAGKKAERDTNGLMYYRYLELDDWSLSDEVAKHIWQIVKEYIK